MNIVFLDGYTLQASSHTMEQLQAFGQLTIYDRTSPEQIIERSINADILIVNKTPLSEGTIAQLPKLRLICVAATGYDKVDTDYARKKGIPVCNCAGYSSKAVAQMALSLLLEAADHVGFYTEENRKGRWSECDDFCYMTRPRLDLDNRRMAIIGLGSIGQTLANIMHTLGLQLFAVTSKDEASLPPYVHKISMEEAFSTCDIVSLNCPLTPQNRTFVNASLLAKAKRGLILINTARGGLINEQDVADALCSGTLGAYCADVMTQEPPEADNPLFTAPNAYLTPHIGWKTPVTVERIVSLLAQNIEGFLNGSPVSVVNK